MKVLALSEVKTKLSALVDIVQRRDESITITRNGKPVAMIVSSDEYEAWHETSQILRDSEFLREILDGVRNLARTKRRHTLKDLFGE